jgi:hypothetical protein
MDRTSKAVGLAPILKAAAELPFVVLAILALPACLLVVILLKDVLPDIRWGSFALTWHRRQDLGLIKGTRKLTPAMGDDFDVASPSNQQASHASENPT